MPVPGTPVTASGTVAPGDNVHGRLGTIVGIGIGVEVGVGVGIEVEVQALTTNEHRRHSSNTVLRSR